MAAEADQQRCEVYYQGMVQGVGFRYTTRRIAAQYAVTGFVRNLPDGRVSLVVEGAVGEIEDFLLAIQDSLGRYIDGIEQSMSPARREFREFSIRH